MYQQIDQRLAELNREFEQGSARLQRMERERAELRETLFRIQGALLVLKELAADAGGQDRTQNLPEEAAEIRIPVAAGDATPAHEKHPQSIEGESHD